MIEKITDIITTRCSEDINQSLTNTATCNSDPILRWNHLLSQYGPARQGEQDIGNSLIKAINTYMLDDEYIANAARFNDGQKLGFILVSLDDQDSKRLRISPLAPRLDDAVNKCRQENFDYADGWLRLTDHNNTKRVRALKEVSNLKLETFPCYAITAPIIVISLRTVC